MSGVGTGLWRYPADVGSVNRQASRHAAACEQTEEPSLVSECGPAAVIILAAGEGTRMKTPVPKMLLEVCGRPMLGHVIAAARELRSTRLIVVVGHGAKQVTDYLADEAPEAQIVVQERRGGTGHAVRVALTAVGMIHGTVIVTYSDTPLLRGETLRELVREHGASGAAVTALTAEVAEPTGYGRIVRDDSGAFAAIVEEADASPLQRAIREINTGVYAFDGDLLASAITRLRRDNAKGEEYLTDVASILRGDGHGVATVLCADLEEIQGVNDQAQLAHVRRVMKGRLLGASSAAGAADRGPGNFGRAAGNGAAGSGASGAGASAARRI
jgi:bifunctional UDP-N-acetylglucosamine pyrophosphorylase/glucosamine-1-phosphate N-acetyltransferase